MIRKANEAKSPLLGLTEKERAVLEAMATGRNNATIAKSLYMSERAVEKHIGSVFQKLGLVDEGEMNRRVMAVLKFVEADLLTRRRTAVGAMRLTAPARRSGSCTADCLSGRLRS